MHAAQARLFDEADALAAATTEADETAVLPQALPVQQEPVQKTPVALGKRQPLPVELPRIDIVHEVPLEQRTCACGAPMGKIGEDVNEQLDIIPMQVSVLRHVRKRYACPDGDMAPVTASVQAQGLPQSKQCEQRAAGDVVNSKIRRRPTPSSFR